MATSPKIKDEGAIPIHVAIIMDGNGRWAAAKGLPRAAGHRQGAEAVRATVKGCASLGIRYLTLFAFSSENWKRPANEVDALMSLLRLYIRQEIKYLNNSGVRVRFIGAREDLADDIIQLVEHSETTTRSNDRLTLTIALNYGSRAEIVKCVQEIAALVEAGELAHEAIDESLIERHLSSKDLPDPDLVIRTSGEQRLSNFLLWQSAYSELVFLDTLWPDFDQDTLAEAVRIFAARERRFGARG
jgi:undecaprenyl diphosphate synthase